MKALLRFAAWATLTAVLAWLVAHPYQRAIAGIAARIAIPNYEVMEIDTYFPYDLGVFVALCLASTWVPWRARLRALGIGAPIIVALEIVTDAVALRVLVGTAGQHAQQVEEASRFIDGVVRLTGLVAAGVTWVYLLGWQQLPQLAESFAARRPAARGGKR